MTFRDIQDVWSFTTRNEHIQGPWPDSGIRGFPGPPCRGCHTAPTPATLPLMNVQPGLGLSGSNQAHRETWQDPRCPEKQEQASRQPLPRPGPRDPPQEQVLWFPERERSSVVLAGSHFKGSGR